MRKNIALRTGFALLALSGCAAIDHGVSDRFTAYLSGGLMALGVRGDPDGSGMALIWMGEAPGPSCYNVSVRRIGPVTAAHLHRSAADAPWPADGPVVATLRPFRKGESNGCFKNMGDQGRSLSREIRSNPSAFYFDVHNEEFPGGALRGKLEPAKPKIDR